MRNFLSKLRFNFKQLFKYKGLKRFYYQKFIFPIYRSEKPVAEISLGVSIGVFWGMTPTVGIQMYVIFLQWLLLRTFTRVRFDLVLAIAMVWISNPLTVIPLYFLFHITGDFLISFFQLPIPHADNFELFIQKFNDIYTNSDIDFLQKGSTIIRLFFSSWGISLLLGSIGYAVSSAVISYYVTAKILAPLIKKRRIRKAGKRSRIARNKLLQESTSKKRVVFIKKNRLKSEAKQKKIVKNKISKDIQEMKDVTE